MTTDTDVELKQRALVNLLVPYVKARAKAKDASDDLGGLKKLLNAYLDEHPDERLRDGENGIEAWHRNTAGSPQLSAMELAANRPDLLVWMAAKNLLKLNLKAWEAMDNQAAEWLAIKQYVGPGPGSTSMQVVAEERRD